MRKEYWASTTYRVIYFANAAVGLTLGVGGFVKSETGAQVDMIVWGSLSFIYGVFFAWAFYLVATKPIIVVDDTELLDRSFFMKNRIYTPLSDYSVDRRYGDLGLVLNKDGKAHPTSSGHLSKQHAKALHLQLLEICSNKRMQSDQQTATRFADR